MDATASSNDALKDEFMQLLVTQLKNQDPLSPVEQQDFIGQLAQFSTLEGIESLNANFSDMLRVQELTQGAELLGKNVEFYDSLGVAEQGTVDAVRVEDQRVVMEVNGRDVSITDVQRIVN